MPIASSNGVRLVLDTNTAISGLLWGGTPGRLIDAAKAGQVELVSSAPLLAELQGVLSRPKFAQQLEQRGVTFGDVFDGYAALVRLVVPAGIAPTIVRDPADDQVLATAIAGQVDLIVSGGFCCENGKVGSRDPKKGGHASLPPSSRRLSRRRKEQRSMIAKRIDIRASGAHAS
jgi:putative PIN family toxin of toxin-antitoxin system